MSKAQTDIRTTSTDLDYADPVGFHGTLEDAIAQAAARPDFGLKAPGNERRELLHFLGVDKPVRMLSGVQQFVSGPDVTRDELSRMAALPEDDSVVYGQPEAPKQPWDGFSPWSLEYAMARWPESFKHG